VNLTHPEYFMQRRKEKTQGATKNGPLDFHRAAHTLKRDVESIARRA
jgi:hypothetical protein